MKKFWKDIFAWIGYIMGVIGTIISIIFLPGVCTIRTNLLIAGIVILISALTITGRTVFLYNRLLQSGTRFKIISYAHDNGKDLYYTNYSKNIRYGTIVSIYYEKPMSKKIGYGIVRNNSVDEYIEIELISVQKDYLEIFEQSKTNSHKVLQDMYILPNIYKENVNDIASYLSGGAHS